MNGILLICEGKQDVSLVSLLLELIGFSEYKKLVKEFEQPLQNFFVTQIKNFEYDNNRLRKGPNLPLIYRQPNNHRQFAIVYSIDGLRNIERAKSVVESYRTAIQYGLAVETMSISLSLCIMMDADDIGIEGRINQIKEEYRDNIENVELAEHNMVIDEKFYKGFGCYIMSGNDGKGSLEDIIIGALNKNEDFKKKLSTSKDFLGSYLFERKVRKGDDWVVDKKKTESDKKKSMISAASQFDYSGLDNSDLIRKNKVLKGILSNHDKSKEMIALFKKLLTAARR